MPLFARTLAFALLAAAVVAPARGAAAAPAKPAKPAKPWVEMDRGPFMSLTLEAPAPAGNLAYKGIVVPLTADRSASVVFDTDLLRWAAGWRGGFVDWRNIALDGSHGTHCRIVGEQAFGTAKAPGWARPGTDSLADPRALPFGPLPRDWAQWKGLYRRGDRVILSYRVGATDVLESADLIDRDGATAFARRMRVGPRAAPLLAVVSDTPGALVRLVGGGAELVRDGDHVHLRVPAGGQPVDLTVLTAAGGGGDDRAAALDRLAAGVSPAVPGLFDDLSAGGPAQYKALSTRAGPAAEATGPFAVDTLTPPADNPWHALVRPGGLDFFKGGRRAAVCTWDGDVWVVDGLGTDAPGELTWTRFATGLFQPLGLVVRDEQVYVLGRDQITRLRDLNGDGEADFYEAFNHDAQVTEHFHEFAMDLQLVPPRAAGAPAGGGAAVPGDFYYMKGACHAKDATVPQHGTLIRVSADGATSEIVCYGFRAPNGLAIGPDGHFYTTDQQGHWTPANRVNRIEPGKFYGDNQAYLPRPKPAGYEPPIAWLHPKFDRSPAEPFFVDGAKWGPLAGRLLLSSYGTGTVELVMTEEVEGRVQGGVVKLPLPQFPTGVMRARFNPADGQLYACGLFGWAGDRTQAGGLYRVRYTGRPVRVPVDLHATSAGVVVTFAEPLDPAAAADPQNYGVARWNYQRTAGYGSPDLRVNDGRPGQEPMKVTGVRVSKDRRTVRLDLADMRPAMQMQISYNLDAADGGTVRGEIQSTVTALGDPARWDPLTAP
ncbi:MAG TPA: DUF6797 domain-containing protein [Humisphaera sp.]